MKLGFINKKIKKNIVLASELKDPSGRNRAEDFEWNWKYPKGGT